MNNSTEEQEQSAFVQWLSLKGIKHTCVPNSTYTTSWAQKAKNKRTGLNPGFPDLVCILKNKAGLNFVAIEMKRPSVKPKRRGKGGVGDEQKLWIDSLNMCEGVTAVVCYGFAEAVGFVEEFEKKNI